MVTVIVTAYNVAPFLSEAIESVLTQTYRDLEIIVVDDGSSDDSAEVATRYQRDGIRLVRQANQGPASSLNTGLRLASGEYVAILDGDDTWHPEKIAAHIDCFERNPETDLTFSWSDWIDEQGRLTGLHTQRCEGTFSFRSLFEDFVIGNTSSVVIRRSRVSGGDYCDPEFSRYYDVDLFLRIAQRGPDKVRAVPRTLTLYRRHAGQMSRDWQGMQQDWQRLVRKHAGGISPDGRARAFDNMARYFAFLAYESANYTEAANILRGSLVDAPGLFLRDGRNWKLCAAVASAVLLPRGIHRRLESLGKRLS